MLRFTGATTNGVGALTREVYLDAVAISLGGGGKAGTRSLNPPTNRQSGTSITPVTPE